MQIATRYNDGNRFFLHRLSISLQVYPAADKEQTVWVHKSTGGGFHKIDNGSIYKANIMLLNKSIDVIFQTE